jgi:hypothetical protein
MKKTNKKKILFIINHEYPDNWKDGLWAAMDKLKGDFDIVQWNLFTDEPLIADPKDFDFILGWGAFGGPVDNYMSALRQVVKKKPFGLCVAGNVVSPGSPDVYDILFYETEWAKDWILSHDPTLEDKLMHAFGINRLIYNESLGHTDKIWDYTTVGSFSLWKRHILMLDKPGYKLAIGEIQKGNPGESLDIIGDLLLGGIVISDMVEPETLATIYHCSRCVYIPADITGGGERAVLEARACNINVEVEPDNEKLEELLKSPLWDHLYYAEQLKKGIEKCLINQN